MSKSKDVLIKIIEFYLRNIFQINRELQYRKQTKNTSPIIINKLYKAIPFQELDSIAQIINYSLSKLDEKKYEYIRLRYKNKCTYDVICGLLEKKRSTIFAIGNDILNDILFDILTNDAARNAILKSDTKSYFLDKPE